MAKMKKKTKATSVFSPAVEKKIARKKLEAPATASASTASVKTPAPDRATASATSAAARAQRRKMDKPFVRRSHPGHAYPGDDVELVWSKDSLFNGRIRKAGERFDRKECSEAKARRLWYFGACLQVANPKEAEAMEQESGAGAKDEAELEHSTA